MFPNEKLQRINELAQKAKTTGLTDKEKEEQQQLREDYLSIFRSAFKNQLHSLKVIDPEGTDVTPQKLKDSKENRKKH